MLENNRHEKISRRFTNEGKGNDHRGEEEEQQQEVSSSQVKSKLSE